VTAARDPYEVLGVPRNATTHDIRAAYVARARRSHPDLVGPRGLELMRALNEAWEILKDGARRTAFDVASGGPATPPGAGGGGAADDPDRPFWTGAAGPAPGRPWGPILDYGIFAGWSIGEISRRDRGYLVWLRERPEAKGIREDIDRLLDPDAEEPVTNRRGGRR